MTNRFSELTQDIQDRIREIAYLMWESAGRQHGMAMEYWLSAEQEVLSTLQAAAHRMLPEAEAKSSTAEKSAPPKGAGLAIEPPASEAVPALAAAKPATRRTTRAKAKA
jgi:hypothetical protein